MSAGLAVAAASTSLLCLAFAQGIRIVFLSQRSYNDETLFYLIVTAATVLGLIGKFLAFSPGSPLQSNLQAASIFTALVALLALFGGGGPLCAICLILSELSYQSFLLRAVERPGTQLVWAVRSSRIVTALAPVCWVVLPVALSQLNVKALSKATGTAVFGSLAAAAVLHLWSISLARSAIRSQGADLPQF